MRRAWLLVALGLTSQLKAQHEREKQSARRDHLTGLANPKGFYEALSIEIARHRRQRIPLAGVAHQVGTARFGRDPHSSVLDTHCKAHDLDNLYVVDGSFFVSSGAVNPALTIMANALRVGDHIISRLK